MNVDQAVNALFDVISAVFPENPQETSTPETNSRKLKKAIEDMLQAREVPLSTKMRDPNRPQPQCKV